MKKWIALFCLLLCLPLTACSGGGEVMLYVVSSDHIREGMTKGEIGEAATQNGRLALRGSDFTGVDWQQQNFAIDPNAVPTVSVVTAESGGCSLLKATDKEVFVWVQDGTALYVGGFPMGVSNPSRPREVILRDKERYIFSIQFFGTGTDPRFNEDLYDWFYQAGLIKSQLNY